MIWAKQFFNGHSEWKKSWAPDLKRLIINFDLYITEVTVIAMTHRIRYRFPKRIQRIVPHIVTLRLSSNDGLHIDMFFDEVE